MRANVSSSGARNFSPTVVAFAKQARAAAMSPSWKMRHMPAACSTNPRSTQSNNVALLEASAVAPGPAVEALPVAPRQIRRGGQPVDFVDVERRLRLAGGESALFVVRRDRASSAVDAAGRRARTPATLLCQAKNAAAWPGSAPTNIHISAIRSPVTYRRTRS
jgi:hypothetical protein